MDSFNQNQDQNKQLLVVPINSLENWYIKFLNKYKIDPNFLMQSDSWDKYNYINKTFMANKIEL